MRFKIPLFPKVRSHLWELIRPLDYFTPDFLDMLVRMSEFYSIMDAGSENPSFRSGLLREFNRYYSENGTKICKEKNLSNSNASGGAVGVEGEVGRRQRWPRQRGFITFGQS